MRLLTEELETAKDTSRIARLEWQHKMALLRNRLSSAQAFLNETRRQTLEADLRDYRQRLAMAQRKLAVGRLFAAHEGWTFHLVTENELFRGPLLDNVRLLNRYRQGRLDQDLLRPPQAANREETSNTPLKPVLLLAESERPLSTLHHQCDLVADRGNVDCPFPLNVASRLIARG